MKRNLISPCEAAAELERLNVPYGQDRVFRREIDTSDCEQFAGLRCSCGIHAKSHKVAHRDRVDPRQDLVGHLEKDVGIPVRPLLLFGGLIALALIIGRSSHGNGSGNKMLVIRNDITATSFTNHWLDAHR
jgi:hypothetical protein